MEDLANGFQVIECFLHSLSEDVIVITDNTPTKFVQRRGYLEGYFEGLIFVAI